MIDMDNDQEVRELIMSAFNKKYKTSELSAIAVLFFVACAFRKNKEHPELGEVNEIIDLLCNNIKLQYISMKEKIDDLMEDLND